MFRWFLATTALAVSLASASAAFVVTVTPSVGPDRANSPAFPQYAQNAAYGLRAGTTNGTPGSANFYAPSGTAQGGGAINYLTQPLTNPAVIAAGVTNLWNGVVNAGPPAPSGQTGNWVYFGLTITGTAGETFTASQVNYNGSNYPFNGPNFGAQSLAGANSLYSNIGGVLTPVTDSTVVSNLYYVGLGYSIGNTAPGDYTNAATLQAYMTHPSTPSGLLTASYTINNGVNPAVTGAGGVDINGTPAPATIALMGLGLAGLVARARRRMA
jgi:hypothetical protein